MSWQFDLRRNAYCFWNASENAWVYENGSRQPLGSVTPQAVSSVGTQRSNQPRNTHATAGASGNYPSNLNTAQAYTNQQHYLRTDQAPVAYTTYTAGHGTQVWPANQFASNTQSGSGYIRANVERLSNGAVLLRGSEGEQELLDSRYAVRKPGNRFFVVGKVFKVLWPELAGQVDEHTSISSNNRFHEPVHYKVRWFVVVMTGKNYCTCLSIQTYSRRGVSKRGIPKNEHAIIYTGRTQPLPLDAELPQRAGEEGMLQSIRVRASNGGTLDVMSRINFGKIYTVEHNVKVFDFGQVHTESERRLHNQFMLVLHRRMQSSAQTMNTSQPIPEDEEDEDEHEESEEEYEDSGEE